MVQKQMLIFKTGGNKPDLSSPFIHSKNLSTCLYTAHPRVQWLSRKRLTAPNSSIMATGSLKRRNTKMEWIRQEPQQMKKNTYGGTCKRQTNKNTLFHEWLKKQKSGVNISSRITHDLIIKFKNRIQIYWIGF